MNAKKKRRLAFVAALLAVGAALAGVIVYGLGENVHVFPQPQRCGGKDRWARASIRLGRNGGKRQCAAWFRR
jgi:cytochrome c-type biogenesis protein CcmE